MKTFYRCVSAAVIATVLSTAALAPKKANAFLLLTFGGAVAPALVIIGASAVVGATGDALSIAYVRSKPVKVGLVILSSLVGVAGSLFGYVVLDERGTAGLEYAAVQADQLRRLGATQEQADRYNHELPEINAIAEQIGSDLVREGRATMSRENLDYVSARWAAYGAGLSPGSLDIVRKIGALVAKGAR